MGGGKDRPRAELLHNKVPAEANQTDSFLFIDGLNLARKILNIFHFLLFRSYPNLFPLSPPN